MIVYKITNTLNGKLYVGQTRQPIEKRFLQHASANTPLGRAMRDCGTENFTVEVVEECATLDRLKEREQFWIRVLKCKVPNGYNQSDGGESCCNKVFRPRNRFVTSGKMTVAESLKRFRKHLKLSQTEVARTLKMKQQSYSRFERGESSPRVDDLLKLADTYDVSVDYLLGRSDDPRPIKLDEKTLALVRLMQETFQTKQTATV